MLTPENRSALARRHVSRRRRSVSRLVPQLAADRRRAEAASRLIANAPPTAGRWMREGRAHVEIARQHHRSRKDRQEIWRGICCACGSRRSISRKTFACRNHRRPALGGVSQAAQHVPLHARQLGTISIRQTDAVPAKSWPASTLGFCLRAEDLVRRCLDCYGEYAFHKVYRAVYDFATTDLSAVYFDVSKDRLYTAGPDSHSAAQRQTALYRLNLALVALARAHSFFHLRRGVAAHQAGRLRHGRAFILISSPSAED